MTDLKKCPFCGGEAELKDLGIGRGGYIIECQSCPLFMTGGIAREVDVNDRQAVYDRRKKQAIDAWNKRYE